MDQFASGTAREMLAQARALFRLYPDADRAYMDRRSKCALLNAIEDAGGKW